MTVELRHLRHFVAVVEEGQVSAAALRLHLAQPALSQSIRVLEQRLGVALLHRHPRGVSPTPAGRRFLPGAYKALAAVDAAVANVRELAPQQRALTLGSLPSGVHGVQPTVLDFRRRFTDVCVSWRVLNFLEELTAVVNGDVDASFLWPHYRVPGLRFEDINTMPPYLYVDATSPLAHLPSARFDDFGDGTWPGQHPALPNEFADLYYLTAHRGYRPPLAVETPLTVDDTWALIASGKAMTVAPGPIFPTTGMVISLPVVDLPPFVTQVVWCEDNQNPALAALVEMFRFERDTVPLAREDRSTTR